MSEFFVSTHIDDMFALISPDPRIHASTCWLFVDRDFIYIPRRPCHVKFLNLMRSIAVHFPLAVNEEHWLGYRTLQSVVKLIWRPLPKPMQSFFDMATLPIRRLLSILWLRLPLRLRCWFGLRLWDGCCRISPGQGIPIIRVGDIYDHPFTYGPPLPLLRRQTLRRDRSRAGTIIDGNRIEYCSAQLVRPWTTSPTSC